MSKKGVHQKGYRHDGHSRFRPSMFDHINLEQYVPADHPMRKSGDLYDVLGEWYKHSREFQPDCRWVCHLSGRKLNSIKNLFEIHGMAV